MQTVALPQKQPHWFEKMCEVITTQQSRHEAGSLDTPPMLTPGNYVQWASRFLSFVELKKPHGKYLKQVILEGPFQMPTKFLAGDPNAIPPRPDSFIEVAESSLTAEQILHREANDYAMVYIKQGIPNPIFRAIDAQKTAKAMWEHVHLLMEGTELNQEDMESKLYMEYTKFMMEPGESLESYYHRFTNIINDLDRNNVILPRIAINTTFVGSLSPEWQKYVTFVRQAKKLHHEPYGLLYDFLKHHQAEVDKERALTTPYATPTSNPLALVAQSYPQPLPSNHAFFQQQQNFAYPPQLPSPQSAPYDSHQHNDNQLTPYNSADSVYFSQSNEDDLDQAEAFGALNEAYALITRAFNKYPPFNNRLRTSSNTRNQAVVNNG